MIVNVDGVPVHPFADGVTVMVEIIGVVPLLMATDAAILSLPFVPNPTSIDEAQEKLELLIGPLKLIAVAASPLQ